MSNPRRLLIAFVVVALATLSTTALAQQPQSDEDAARELYVEGMRLYNLGKYDEAIAKYEEGYRLAPMPGFLYNLAQAHRLKGDCANAYRLYKNFLRLAEDVEHRDEIEGLMAEMEECRNNGGTETPDPEPDPDPEDPVDNVGPFAEPENETPPRGARGKKVGGIVTASIGLILVGTGAYFALDASDASGEISELFEQGGTWSEEYDDIEARGKRSSTLSTVFFATGTLAVVGGAVLYYLGVRDGQSAESGPVIDPNPAQPTVGWAWGF
jgi:tetratricopeptide (TPR) repeat protein